MIRVKGKIENGHVLVLEPIDEAFEGHDVEITLIDKSTQVNGNGNENGLASLMRFIQENSVDTGITDMAHQHDHYLYGTPKHDD